MILRVDRVFWLAATRPRHRDATPTGMQALWCRGWTSADRANTWPTPPPGSDQKDHCVPNITGPCSALGSARDAERTSSASELPLQERGRGEVRRGTRLRVARDHDLNVHATVVHPVRRDAIRAVMRFGIRRAGTGVSGLEADVSVGSNAERRGDGNDDRHQKLQRNTKPDKPS